ncbi:hypothetical protein FGO68_gene16223 [Halteria grandinella]|uniref:Uncharacterized protein n=1 Tax=Halteria grandinella TaxID=5974 RepID=A0A8J8T3L5_HALGN|nr:hypothetical protein FGO68_gene16223 [Halteria grandinella]
MQNNYQRTTMKEELNKLMFGSMNSSIMVESKTPERPIYQLAATIKYPPNTDYQQRHPTFEAIQESAQKALPSSSSRSGKETFQLE